MKAPADKQLTRNNGNAGRSVLACVTYHLTMVRIKDVYL